MPCLKPRVAGLFLAVLAAFPLQASLPPETGAFIFQNYVPKAYGASPQNWAIAQDSRGVMYFGNTDGVLEFDGVFWRLIRLPSGSAARSLAVDATGRVCVGGQGVFGYLAPDAKGAMQFVPLAVPKADADFYDVWNVLPTPAGVYFSANARIFLLTNSGQIKVWRTDQRFGRIFTAYGELFATTFSHGLERLQGDRFVPGPSGDPALVHGNVTFAMGEHPLIASRGALFNFSLSEIVPFENGAAAHLEHYGINSLKQLSSGDVAVGTLSGGLVLLNRDGAVERVIRKADGLTSDRINAIFEDREHAVWLATENGLGRFTPGLSSFGELQGLRGSVFVETRFAGDLFVGTSRGIFHMRPQPAAVPSFAEISGLQEPIFALAEQDGQLFAGGQYGLYRIAKGTAERLLTTETNYDIGPSRRAATVMYTAGVDGVRQWKETGNTWRSSQPVRSEGEEFRTVVEDTDGRVWATTKNRSIWRMDFSFQPPRLQQFTTTDGVPAGGYKNAYFFQGRVVFATPTGLAHFSESKQRFEPDTSLGSEYADGKKGVSIVREDPSGNVWITGNGYHTFLEKDRTGFRPFVSPLLETGADELWTIFLDPDGTSWASSDSGSLFRLEKLDLAKRRENLRALLRRVTVIGQKEPLFEGDSDLPNSLALVHKQNALRFEFASPFYEAASALEYQFQLEGNEKQWSPWTVETHKDYTNLFEGKYRFRVRVRDPHGNIGQEEVPFPFHVLPPFYRTWWALLAYISVFLFAGWLILRWRLNALKARNRWLEGVVEERTAEVRQERDQNEALLLNILPKPVATELRTSGAVKPTSFEDVTVCFSDFVGFTLSSEQLPADTLITALNEYFTAFDEIIGRYGLEKLKTIGDAYMFAGGLPNLRPSHAVDAVLGALEMAAVVERLTRPDRGVNWKIRLGLYSGPVVSGVVGVRKFAFDIWGNTVNFAARMESAGKPGRVNLSATTFERVERFIECEHRGAVPIKEGRRMDMYFAISPKLELLQGPLVNGVPKAFLDEYQKAFGEPVRSFPSASTLDQLVRSSVAVPGDPQ